MAENNGSTAIVTIRDARGFLTDPQVMDQIQMTVAKTIDPDRLVRVALTAMSRNPQLLECTPQSWALALMEAGSVGLEPTGVLGHAYLVPTWNKKAHGGRGGLEAQFRVGYRGLVELARRSGEVRDVYAEVVREGDDFFYNLGTHRELRHTPRGGLDRPVTHVYAVALYTDGYERFEVLEEAEVQRIKNRSPAANNGPWVTDTDEMRKKTAVRRLAKWLPLSPEAQAVVAYEDEAEYGRGDEPATLRRFLPATAEEVPEPESDSSRVAGATRQKLTSLRQRMQEPPAAASMPTSAAEHGKRIREAEEADTPFKGEHELLADAPMSGRTRGALDRAGLKTVGDLLGKTRAQLSRLPGVGDVALEEIDHFTQKRGFELAPEPKQAPPDPELKRAKARYFALWKERAPQGVDRHAWQAEHIGVRSSKDFGVAEFRKAAAMVEDGIGFSTPEPEEQRDPSERDMEAAGQATFGDLPL